MGGFDMYCKVCGLPFHPFYDTVWKHKTTWLRDAILNYNGHKLRLTSYGDGEFKPKSPPTIKDSNFLKCYNNGKLNVSLLYDHADPFVCHHEACEKRHDIQNVVNAQKQIKKFQGQYFDQEEFIKSENASLHWLMDKPSKTKKPQQQLDKSCMIMNPDTGRHVNVSGPTGIKLLKKYAPMLVIQT